jgi:biopolymer transport protein TolR
MSMTFGADGRASSEINVTPMIDILLVLLVIFMVVFPYQSTGERADIPQPNAAATLPAPGKPIVIQIKQAAGSERPVVRINEEEVGWANLESRLQQIFSLRTEKVAFLKGDPEIDFQYVADAIDIVHHAGVARVGLMGSGA